MRPEQRLRAEVAAELASARLYAAEIRAGCVRRAVDLGRLRERVVSRRVRAALQTAQRDILAVGEAAENALAGFEDDVAKLVAAIHRVG